MYYHPSMLREMDRRRTSQTQDVLLQLLLESIDRQKTVQMGALEIVARLGEIAADTQRHLVDLIGARRDEAAPGPPMNEERNLERDTARDDSRSARKQMIA